MPIKNIGTIKSLTTRALGPSRLYTRFLGNKINISMSGFAMNNFIHYIRSMEDRVTCNSLP